MNVIKDFSYLVGNEFNSRKAISFPLVQVLFDKVKQIFENLHIDLINLQNSLTNYYTKSETDAKIPKDINRSATDGTIVNSSGDTLFYIRQANTQLAGFMTSADKTKLNNTYTKTECDDRYVSKTDYNALVARIEALEANA